MAEKITLVYDYDTFYRISDADRRGMIRMADGATLHLPSGDVDLRKLFEKDTTHARP